MQPFTYERASDLESAVALLARPGTKPLGGGTNLVDLMRLRVETPDTLVDVSGLDFGGVEALPDGGLRIGGTYRNSELAADLLVRTRYPVLAKALLAAASGQLRNMATTAGNLLQRTRCGYFMDATKPCNKREPGSGCPAINGVSRELAILGTSEHCIASYPGDMAVALAALDAVILAETAEASLRLPMEGFHRLPGDRPEQDTTLPPGAIITGVEIPGLAFGARSTYRKARDRRSYAFALASVAAALDVEDGLVRDVRLALGAVAHKPWRARAAEEFLRGRPATAENFREAAELELADARTTEDNAFKVPLVTRLVTGTLLELAGSDR